MGTQQQTDPISVMRRLQEAQNEHDIDAFVECFNPDYVSEQPVHPDRAFTGREQVRKNWSKFFEQVPDFRAELLAITVDGDTAWAEWVWTGANLDGTRLNMRGVTLFGIRDGRLAWGRLYMEPVEEGEGIDAAVDALTKRQAGE